jgi:hypothetical protein
MTVKTKAIAERIRQSIFLIRGQKVMLDIHLAELTKSKRAPSFRR